MRVNRDAVAAFVLLAMFLAYGYQATLIELFPGQETDAFSPRTMPYALAVGGVLLSILQLARNLRQVSDEPTEVANFDWWRAGLLCISMIVYGLIFTPLGFIGATSLFLAAGFLILGERRYSVLIGLPPLFTMLFWAVMTRGLGLYLAPGKFGL